ncbi:MAG: hypothetical protein AAGB29_05490 [Planctomycetota bacterium]
MRPQLNPRRPIASALAARMAAIGLAVAALAVLPAPSASADRFSIGFGYSSGGYKYGHGRHYRGGYGNWIYQPGFSRYGRYGRYGCGGYGYGLGYGYPGYRSSVFYGGSNFGVGLSYRGYYPAYRPRTAYVVQAPPVVTERTVVVREPAAATVETVNNTAAAINRDTPFGDTQRSKQVAVALDALALGEYATARQAYAKAMAASPGVESYKIGFGLAAALGGDLRTARFAFERAIRQGGADEFNTFLVEGAAVEDLHALVGSMGADTNRVVAAGLKKLAAANPLPAGAYQLGKTDTPTADL